MSLMELAGEKGVLQAAKDKQAAEEEAHRRDEEFRRIRRAQSRRIMIGLSNTYGYNDGED